MRIVHVVNVRWYNATAWYGLTLARLMRDAGHQVAVLVLPGAEPGAKARALGLDVREMDLNARAPWAIARLVRDLRRFVKEFAPDLVNCHRGESFVLWGLLKSAGARFALVRTRGDQRSPKNNLPNRWLHGRVADAVVATNTSTAAVLREELKVPADRLHCIRGGVDTAAFAFNAAGRERVRREFGFEDRHCVVGLLGRFDRVKGQRELIQAVKLLVERGRAELKLFLIGFETATRETEIRAWLEEFQMNDQCVISGRRDDVADCIAACDIGVVASLWSEAIARAALEIMACGRPLVSTRVGVMPDLLENEALVVPGDVYGLAAALDRVIQDSALQRRCLDSQKQRLQTLDLASFLNQTLDVYHDALGRAARKP